MGDNVIRWRECSLEIVTLIWGSLGGGRKKMAASERPLEVGGSSWTRAKGTETTNDDELADDGETDVEQQLGQRPSQSARKQAPDGHNGAAGSGLRKSGGQAGERDSADGECELEIGKSVAVDVELGPEPQLSSAHLMAGWLGSSGELAEERLETEGGCR